MSRGLKKMKRGEIMGGRGKEEVPMPQMEIVGKIIPDHFRGTGKKVPTAPLPF